MTPSAAPTNINELRAKNPEPTHPARDPTTQPASRIWPQKADTGAWWEEEDGQEYIQQHFSIKHITQYFRTRSPVSAADIDGWRARELMAPLFMGASGAHQRPFDLTISFWRCSPLPHTRIRRQPFTRTRETCQRPWGYSAPSSAAKASVAVSPASPPTLSRVLSLVFLHLHTKKIADNRSPGRCLPLRQDSFCHVCRT
jgi:hypothetical protein